MDVLIEKFITRAKQKQEKLRRNMDEFSFNDQYNKALIVLTNKPSLFFVWMQLIYYRNNLKNNIIWNKIVEGLIVIVENIIDEEGTKELKQAKENYYKTLEGIR